MIGNDLDPKYEVKTERGTIIRDPKFVQFLFSDVRVAPLWLVLRVLLGWGWLSAGMGKLGNPAWMETGNALKGYWTNAVSIPATGSPPIAFDWYRNFIQSLLDAGTYTWFAKVIVFSEILVGVALILGMFVGVAAFIGAFLDWNYIMAGSASSNGLYGLIAIFLILAWKTAGWYGLDRWILPRLGTTFLDKPNSPPAPIPAATPPPTKLPS